jgi:hypothetical protein
MKGDDIKMNEADFYECGSIDTDEIFKVIRPFYCIVKAGPPVPIPVGASIRLRADSGRDNFAIGRIVPVNFPALAEYEVIAKFTTTDKDGYWLSLNPGDRVELSAEESLPLLRTFKIKRLEGGDKK